MKKILVVLVSCLTLISCKKSSPKPVYNNATSSNNNSKVIKVFEFGTNLPIEGAQVDYTIWNLGSYDTYYLKPTDKNGNACCVPFGPTLVSLNVYKSGFDDAATIESGEVFYLKRFAYLKLNIKNISPALLSDTLRLTIDPSTKPIYIGDNVDISPIFRISSTVTSISWKKDGINHNVNVSLYPKDTTIVNVNY